tara:strand:+ start:200 stop:532 length:333 start_codon:yes stop_codon:yes gene_type:complete
MLRIQSYKNLTHIIFLSLIFIKFLNVLQGRIEIELFLIWITPMAIFYYFINKLMVKAYQWFCFVLLIYFLSSSIRVFGVSAYWLDVAELIFVSLLFIQVMFGPKIINRMN